MNAHELPYESYPPPEEESGMIAESVDFTSDAAADSGGIDSQSLAKQAVLKAGEVVE